MLITHFLLDFRIFYKNKIKIWGEYSRLEQFHDTTLFCAYDPRLFREVDTGVATWHSNLPMQRDCKLELMHTQEKKERTKY